jgi:hypothetical protein
MGDIHRNNCTIQNFTGNNEERSMSRDANSRIVYAFPNKESTTIITIGAILPDAYIVRAVKIRVRFKPGF